MVDAFFFEQGRLFLDGIEQLEGIVIRKNDMARMGMESDDNTLPIGIMRKLLYLI